MLEKRISRQVEEAAQYLFIVVPIAAALGTERPNNRYGLKALTEGESLAMVSPVSSPRFFLTVDPCRGSGTSSDTPRD